MEDESMAQSQSVNVQRVTADGTYKSYEFIQNFIFTKKKNLFTHFSGTYATQSAFDTGKSGTSGSNIKDEKVNFGGSFKNNLQYIQSIGSAIVFR